MCIRDSSTLGTVLELATADSADGEDYEAVLLQRGTVDSYADFILSLIHI